MWPVGLFSSGHSNGFYLVIFLQPGLVLHLQTEKASQREVGSSFFVDGGSVQSYNSIRED